MKYPLTPIRKPLFGSLGGAYFILNVWPLLLAGSVLAALPFVTRHWI